MRQFIHSLRELWKSRRRTVRRRGRSGCRTEALESRCLLTTAPFQTHFVATPTIVPQFTDGRYQFALADLDGDTKQELFAIRPNGTASGKVEVSVYAGGNNYQELIYRKATALNAVSSDWQFRVFEYSNSVLIAAFNPNDSSGSVSVDLMSSSQNYNTSTHFVTAAPASPDLWDLDVADYNNDSYLDVIGVLKHGASNQTEVHVYSGKEEGGGRYQLPLLHAVTPLEPVGSEFDFIARKYDGDSTPDIVGIKRFGTGTNTTEIHVLSGSSGYSSFIEHIPPGLHETQGNNFNSTWSITLR